MGGKVSTSAGGGAAAQRGATQLWTQSNPARKAMFRQLASVLATGGKGAKMPFIQNAVAQSRDAGMAALRGASESLSGVAPEQRSMILNRIGRTNLKMTGDIAPSIASQMIAQAPAAALGTSGPSAAGFSISTSGQQAATEATVARARAFSGMMAKIGSALGYNSGDWLAGSGSPGGGGRVQQQAPSRDQWRYDSSRDAWTNDSRNPSFGAEFDRPGSAGNPAGGGWYEKYFKPAAAAFSRL